MKLVTRDDVISAYRLILGREPESEDSVDEKLTEGVTIEQLRTRFFNSSEYRSKNIDVLDAIRNAYLDSNDNIEVDVKNKELMLRLNERVFKQWEKLGNSDPYWSVLTHDKFLSSRINDKVLEEFYETGKSTAKFIDIFEDRCGVSINREVCFELGCGVGRITHALAETFKKVIATDISSGNLRLCSDFMRQRQIENVECVLLRDSMQLDEIANFDLFFSFIVLQHNPPPIQKDLIERSLSKLRRGGYCLFQTPDRLVDSASNNKYSFGVEKFLSSAASEMDMHCLPKQVVINILNESGMKIIDIVPDTFTGQFGSYTYFAVKT